MVKDAVDEPDFSPWMPHARSGVSVPVLSGDEVVAILDVEGDLPQAFDRGKVITLETLADGIGIILRNAELYQALEGTNARLVELDRMKSELVNIVAHDFRAPLSAILGWAELLEAKPEAPVAERRERAQAIVKAANRMAGLMDKTLETTRLETGHFAFDFGLIDLGARLRDGVAHYASDPQHPARPRPAGVPAALLGGRGAAGRGAGEPAQQRGQVLAEGRRGARRRCGASARPRS